MAVTTTVTLAAATLSAVSLGFGPAIAVLPHDATTRAADIECGGRGKITGTVKVDATPDIPVRKRVRLFRDNDARFVAETWSDATTGAYEFADIDATQRYSVVSYDSDHIFRAVIADNLTPEPM